ncbi:MULTISPECIES: YdaS family helix-turn-helix protein [unclassified Janthinobacterium]|uniref:transcriptional regulator n=1 Tax=unclassified Janthinobacterium TaxID=2610881 RepID=UPI0018CA7F31|nr:YdaS family helix-turn-helix protein [Janthinobacterium sp. CG_23.4]
MNLSTYLTNSKTRQVDFARALQISPAVLHQWIKSIRPIPIRYCASIESLTAGQVTRQELRPDDWNLIWPDLPNAQIEMR